MCPIKDLEFIVGLASFALKQLSLPGPSCLFHPCRQTLIIPPASWLIFFACPGAVALLQKCYILPEEKQTVSGAAKVFGMGGVGKVTLAKPISPNSILHNAQPNSCKIWWSICFARVVLPIAPLPMKKDKLNWRLRQICSVLSFLYSLRMVPVKYFFCSPGDYFGARINAKFGASSRRSRFYLQSILYGQYRNRLMKLLKLSAHHGLLGN